MSQLKFATMFVFITKIDQDMIEFMHILYSLAMKSGVALETIKINIAQMSILIPLSRH